MSPGIVGDTRPAYPSMTLGVDDVVNVDDSSSSSDQRVLLGTPNGDRLADKNTEYKATGLVSQQFSTSSILSIFVQKDAKVRVTDTVSGKQDVHSGPLKLFPPQGQIFKKLATDSKNVIVAPNHHVGVSKSVDNPGCRVLLNTRNSSVFASSGGHHVEYRVTLQPNELPRHVNNFLYITVEAGAEVLVSDTTSPEQRTCPGPCKLSPPEGGYFYKWRFGPAPTAFE